MNKKFHGEFDPAHDKISDQPVTIGGDKSAAAWHGAHADLSTLDKVTASYDEALREARAERDALAHVVEQVRWAITMTDDGWYVTDEDKLQTILEAAPAVSLALHDAEVKAQALDDAADLAAHDHQTVTLVRMDLLPTVQATGERIAFNLQARADSFRAEAK